VQRAALEVGIEHGAVLGDNGGILEGDRHAVGEPNPLHPHDICVRVETEIGDLLGPRRVQSRRDEAGRRLHSTPGHLLGERQEHSGPAVHRPHGHERPAAALTVDEAGGGKLLHGLAHRHPADVEPGAQLGLGRQGVARRPGGDQPAEMLLDVAVAGALR
jgi:hypothetical protein